MSKRSRLKEQRFVQSGEVELVINHLPGCGCDLGDRSFAAFRQ